MADLRSKGLIRVSTLYKCFSICCECELRGEKLVKWCHYEHVYDQNTVGQGDCNMITNALDLFSTTGGCKLVTVNNIPEAIRCSPHSVHGYYPGVLLVVVPSEVLLKLSHL